MSFFSHAQGFQVNNSQFATTTNNTYLTGPSGVDILREASAPEAAHESSARTYSPRCFPGTRQQYIEDIVGRATPSLDDIPLPIYWIRGPAGVGKSAIAQTCAERLQDMGALGASFFFSISGQRKAEKLFPSIAYQLSTNHPDYRDIVDRKILNDKTLIGRSIQFQFRHLIDEPLRELEANGKGIRRGVQVLVDGLDECEGTDAQVEVIRVVATAASEGVLPLRWAFFSRPEPHIEVAFSAPSVTPHCYKVILPISNDADGEIELYLKNAFINILQRRNPLVQTLWPSTEELKTIVWGAGGSFIYATTVVRFVGRPDSLSPQKRLLTVIDAILEHRSHNDTRTNAPFAELDAFYVLILQRIPKDALPSVRLLLALMCRLGSFGAMLVANILGMSKDDFEVVCHHVSAVIRFEEPGKRLEFEPSIDTSSACSTRVGESFSNNLHQIWYNLGGRVSFYHKSFLDFLLDPSRSGSHCVKASEALANHFVKIHLDYDQSFHWRGSELVLAPGVPDSAASLSYPYTNELINSILKADVYIAVGDEDPDSFPAPREAGGLDANRDFHKYLYTCSNNADIGRVLSCLLWGCASQRKYLWGVRVEYISPSNFPKFVITEFKLMVKWKKRAGIIRRYHPSLTSQVKSLFHNKTRDGVESGFYRMGHGEKAIFWYWEINHKLQCYRSFHSIDLVEGEKKFQEEDFDSWPEYGYDEDEDSDAGHNNKNVGGNDVHGQEQDENEGTSKY